ncbi:hypothetical protein [Actinomadura terrae]|uniref:hypothetical protein n=1 Tax=Actinomadura terrae TaxID=604353 RepID=UPI001FA76450|nr:hypothetical protein [Actinomadura terrae]
MIKDLHSERVAALRTVRTYVTDAGDMACALVAQDGFPALAVSRVDGKAGTLTLGCAYHPDHGEWWFVVLTPRDGVRAAWLVPTRQPLTAANLVIEDMRRRMP